MLDGFVIASKNDLKTKTGVIYLVVFDDGCFYIGSTSQSIRLRYGTYDLSRSCLLASAKLARKLTECISYTVYLYSECGLCDQERLKFEYSLIDSHINEPECLNFRSTSESLSRRRACLLKSPSGTVIRFDSVEDACQSVGAKNHSQVSQVLNGRMKSVLGWTLPDVQGPVGHKLLFKKCELLDQNGVLHNFESYKDAAKVVGVRSVQKLLDGTLTTIKGWTVPGTKRRKYIPLKLISPNGEVIAFSSRVEASIAIGCCNQLVSLLCTGKCSHAKGWTLAEQPELRDGR